VLVIGLQMHEHEAVGGAEEEELVFGAGWDVLL
jgi:hypothetical protein